MTRKKFKINYFFKKQLIKILKNSIAKKEKLNEKYINFNNSNNFGLFIELW
jgi:hypothetical protein